VLADRRVRFEEIYDAYSGLILAYAARRTSNVHDAADVVAETFTVAWRRLDDIPDGEQARPWLYGVARRVLANYHRGVERRRRLHQQMATEVASSFGTEVPEVEGPDLDRIAAALAELSDGDRELLTLVGWDGLDREEIAAMLRCSTATIRVRLHRARKRFARQLNATDLQRTVMPGHGSRRGAPALPDPEET